jgi:hypothetical protein
LALSAAVESACLTAFELRERRAATDPSIVLCEIEILLVVHAPEVNLDIRIWRRFNADLRRVDFWRVVGCK